MHNVERTRFPKDDDFEQTPRSVWNAVKTCVSEFSAAEIKKALINDDEFASPLEELVATGEAVFEFIRNSKMDMGTRNAFYQLEKQFDFYKNLLGLQSLSEDM